MRLSSTRHFVNSQPEAQRLFGTVFRPWLDQRIFDGSPVLRRVLTRVDEWDRYRDPASTLLRAAWELIEDVETAHARAPSHMVHTNLTNRVNFDKSD